MLKLLVAVVGVLARLGVVTMLFKLAWLRCIYGREIWAFSFSSKVFVLARWNWERYRKASELRASLLPFGFHSVGSRSDLALWLSAGILIEW